MSRLLGPQKTQTLKGKGQPPQTRKSGINRVIITQITALAAANKSLARDSSQVWIHSINKALTLLTGAPGFLRVSANLQKLQEKKEKKQVKIKF